MDHYQSELRITECPEDSWSVYQVTGISVAQKQDSYKSGDAMYHNRNHNYHTQISQYAEYMIVELAVVSQRSDKENTILYGRFDKYFATFEDGSVINNLFWRHDSKLF